MTILWFYKGMLCFQAIYNDLFREEGLSYIQFPHRHFRKLICIHMYKKRRNG